MRLTIASALLFLVVGSAAAQNATPAGGGQPPAAGAGNMIRLRMQAVAAQPDTPGIGPYPALKEMAPNGLDFTIYRPRDLNALGGRKLGVHVWGNGGCSFDGGFARFHLMDIASYGYVSLAHGRLQDGPGGLPAPGAPRATAEGMLAALDWILAENSRQGSPYSSASTGRRLPRQETAAVDCWRSKWRRTRESRRSFCRTAASFQPAEPTPGSAA